MGSQGNVLGGTMIIAGTAIGAGMLALPMISAGMWIYWSLLLMVLTWMLMLRASQAILEVNLHYEPGSSFHTLVQDTLGPVWSTINGLAVAFVLYILVYAYVSGGGSTVQQTVMAVTGNDPGMMGSSLFFSLILMACVWWSTRFVDRLSVILMGGMVLTCILSMTGMLSQIRLPVLLDLGENGSGGGAVIFIWCALSTYLTSFCFHASVPSLVKYFGKRPADINKAKTTLVTFLPPLLGGLIKPDGFLAAIGWAGLAATIWSVIVPALMLRASRKKFPAAAYSAPGGSLTIYVLLVYGCITAVCHILFVLHYLPMYE